MSQVFHIYVSDRGNIFMAEIASLLAAAIGDLGFEVAYPAPGLPEPGRDRVNLVVAPHEFFTLQRDATESQLLRAAEACVCVGVEQPGTDWFELGAHYASVGPSVLDISSFAVSELRSRGLDATHVQLGYHPMIDRWGGDPSQARPTDLVFLGALTERRNSFLAGAAPLLWDCDANIRLFEFRRPTREATGHFVAGEDKWRLLAGSRVLLNVHQGSAPYFEWMRVLEAVVNGCLVVSEVSSDYGPLVPGEHLVAAPLDALGAYTASVLTDEPFRADMAAAAYELVRTKLELTALLQPVCARLIETSGHRRVKAKPHPFIPTPAPVQSDNPVVRDALATELRARSRIKELYDSETQLLREVEALQAQARFGNSEHCEVTATPAWAAAEPKVSVVVTCYNYSEFVEEAIESVFASVEVDAELVIVDDHSQDNSVERIRACLGRNPWFPASLVARAANGGVARARNFAANFVRSDLIFTLDADNTIYPRTLSKLARALERQPDAAFAYGIVPRSDGVGLFSCLPWDVDRLCGGNYIDAMAMIRRSVLDELGGYDEYFGLKGWEDYDLWLRIAAAGLGGVLVAELAGRYRVHPTSRQSTVDLDTGPLLEAFRVRYPYLPWN